MIAATLSGHSQLFLREAALLFLGVSEEKLVWVGCFYKGIDHRFPTVSR